MSTYAQELIKDAQLLETPRGIEGIDQHFPTGSMTGYQLIYALALEILLKASIRWNNVERVIGHTDKNDLWGKLATEDQDEIISYARLFADRKKPPLHSGLDDPGQLFKNWGYIFTKVRYRYEIMEDKSEEKQAAQAEAMKEGDFNRDLADWLPCDGERDCMIYALLRYLNAPSRLNTHFDGRVKAWEA